MAAPEPVFRQWHQDPPDYGNDPNLFTIEIEHNGFFTGLRDELTYISGTLDYFDYCHADTFSMLWLEEFLDHLDYRFDGRLHLYWLKPGQDMDVGVECLQNDQDVLAMIRAAAERRIICVMIDHTNFLWTLRPDMISRSDIGIEEGVQDAGQGAGQDPMQGAEQDTRQGAEQYTMQGAEQDTRQRAEQDTMQGAEQDTRQGSEQHTRLLLTYEAEEGSSGQRTQRQPRRGEANQEAVLSEDDTDSDSDFVDSDNDIVDGDDDLFADNVDRDVDDNNDVEDNFQTENEQALDDTDLSLREEEERQLQATFNPVFKAGIVFSTVELLRGALSSYQVRNRRKVVKVKNDQRRLDAICKPGCTWFLKASKDSRKDGSFSIKKYCGKHTCKAQWEIQSLTAPFLAKKFIDEIRDNQKIDLATFAAKVQREFNMCPNRWKLRRARRLALENINGDEDGQFAQLWDYGQELRRSNPGSTFFFSTNRVPGIGTEPAQQHLSTLYWSYGPIKMGFLRGCRPFICVDGCHIKTKYKGVLLTAVGVDGNNCIYPMAHGLVEVECTSSWEWFLTTLKEDLNITNTAPFTIMSDRKKVLINVVEKVWPDADHRFCVRHLYQIFQKAGHRGEVLKNNLWTIARSTNMARYNINLDKMAAASNLAYQWVLDLAPNTWIKAHFSDFPKCDMLLNNHCEVYNSYILEAREMPVLSMLHTIFYKTMQRVNTKQKEAENMTSDICPKIQKIIDKFTQWSQGAVVKAADNGVYHVRTGELERHYTVEFPTRSCDCRRWQLSGIPCHHVIACCREDNFDVEDYVHSCYHINTYKEAYAYPLFPLRGMPMWEKMNGVQVLPPLYTKVMERPKKNRRKAPEEKEVEGNSGAKYVTKSGVTIHCSICKRPGHNKKGHYKYMESNEAGFEVDEEVEAAMQQYEVGEDYDDPSILNNIIHQPVDERSDPAHVVGSMVYRMGHEELEFMPRTRGYGPIPQESSFVVAARDSLPVGRDRGTTTTTRGRATASQGRGTASQGRGNARQGRGRASSSSQGRGTASQGRGRASTTRGRGGSSTADEAGRPSKRSRTNTGGSSTRDVPDLNATVEQEEVPVTQSAPVEQHGMRRAHYRACCEYECTTYGENCIFSL